MKVTLKPTLWVKDTDKDGKAPIAISISGGGKRTYYNTKLKVSEKNWRDGKVTKGEKDYDIINAKIDDLIATANREVLNMHLQREEIKLDKVKLLFNPTIRKNGSFIKFYEDFVELQRTRQSEGYVKHLEVELNQLRTKHPKLGFSDITTEFLHEYEAGLRKTIGGVEVAIEPTTRHTKMKRLKEVVDRAIERGHIPTPQVAGYKLPKYKEPEADYLTLQQVEKLQEMVYDGEFSYDPTMHKIACFFLVECFSGVRFSDWSRYKVETLVKNRNFRVRAQKNKEPIYLPLDKFKRLGRIVDYISEKGLKFDITEQATNRLLKYLGAKIGKPDLTTHVGRHTCGTLLGEMGYSTRAISEVLGISEKTAKRYVKATRQGLKIEFERHGGL